MDDKLQKAFETLGVESAKTDNHLIKSITIGDKIVSVIDFVSKAATLGDINGIISNFYVEKTGKEVKDKLVATKSYDDAQANAYMADAKVWLGKCTVKPTDTTMIGDWELKSVKQKFGQVPPMYTWEEVYAVDKQIENDSKNSQTTYSLNPSNKVEVSKVENCCRMYNQNIRMYVQFRVESLLLDTIINNIDEKKKYQLTATQASALDF